MFRPKQTPADVCLVLEGTYPYVSGGVSTWVHQIISAMPELRFSIFHLGANRESCREKKYQLPANITGLTDVFLFEPANSLVSLRGLAPSNWSAFHEAAEKLADELPKGDERDFELLSTLMRHIAESGHIPFETFWQDRKTWRVIRAIYERHSSGQPFIDYYWTACFLVQPMWALARAMSRMPAAWLYHTACTGYAGLAAAIGAAQHHAPMLVTEHGIYLRERITDICKSSWIPERQKLLPQLHDPLSPLRRLWIGFFDVLGRVCYLKSSAIVSLFEKNAVAQRHFGADPARITIIPNGIRTEECEAAFQKRAARRAANPRSKIIGFLGRVVSIKDVKTLLLAAGRVCSQMPDARFVISGPTAEEPEYYRECVALSEQLGLQEKVTFTGPVARDDFFPGIDIMILTSISEGLPFVVIESLASGVPVVSTDVGACGEILNGAPDESPNLGAAGILASVGNADELALACARLLKEPPLLEEMSRAGRARVSRYYHEREVISAYRNLYQSLLPASEAKAA
jgi:polysaccharide biosynthesis protein PelF